MSGEVWYGDRKYDVALMDHHSALAAKEEAKLLRQMLTAAVMAAGGELVVSQLDYAAAGGHRHALTVEESPLTRTVRIRLE